MIKLENIDYSRVHSKVLRVDGKRVARQIIGCFDEVSDSRLKNSILLDLGSSNGVIAYHLADFVKKAVGIDPDKHAIELGKKEFNKKNLILRTFDGKKIPFPKNKFDIVVFRRTYGNVLDKNKMVQEIMRVLKPGGLCYFEGHNKLFFIESDYKIPFLTLLPISWAISLLKLLGIKKYAFGSYLTYWQLKKLFSQFIIYQLTPKIIKNPVKFKFSKLYKYQNLTNWIPLTFLQLAEPFFPDFIWVLKKN